MPARIGTSTPPPRILCVLGTRPEAIKMAPVILALKREPRVEVRVVSTGQHREMLGPVLDFFNIGIDDDLAILEPGQTLAASLSRALSGLENVLEDARTHAVIAQGDTTTTLAAALAAFYARIPFAHVEGGLRTFKFDSPFPEEFNRVVASRIASLHFAPTRRAVDALRREGANEEDIVLTGNTVIDALHEALRRNPRLPFPLTPGVRTVLVTLHRRESFGDNIVRVCEAIRQLLARYGDLEVVWPLHLNPNVRDPVKAFFGDTPRIRLCDPLGYDHFVAVMREAHIILTDSGGVQEEAPALSKPVLVLREVTERPEAIEAGVAALVGMDTQAVVKAAGRLLDDEAAYRAMARGASPYGDGHAAERIVDSLLTRLGVRGVLI